MSAIEISKLSGMPSAPAFQKKRKRDTEFDAQATAILASRRLANGGRKRIPGESWERFLEFAGKFPVSMVCGMRGMPSESAVYKLRDRDADFAARLLGAHRRRLGTALRRATFEDQLSQNELYMAALASLPVRLDPVERADVTADLVVAVLSGEIPATELRAHAKVCLTRYRRMFGERHISLDMPVAPGSRLTIAETISAGSVRL